MCMAYTDVGGIKQLYHVCPPVRKIIHSLKLVDYPHIQADKPWYNSYVTNGCNFMKLVLNIYDYELVMHMKFHSVIISYRGAIALLIPKFE